MMQVTIDPVIFQTRATGGVSRIYSEILPLMCDIDPNLSLLLQINRQNGDLKQALPQHKNIRYIEYTPFVSPALFPRPLWNQATKLLNYVQDFQQSFRQRGAIWHSSYFTLPPKAWFGKQVTTIYDMNYELLPYYANTEFNHTRAMKARAVHHADIILCISETVRQDTIKYYDLNPDKVFTTPLAYSKDIFKMLEDSFIDNRLAGLGDYVLYVGGRGTHKNFDGLLRMFSQWKSRSEIKMIVVGPAFRAPEQHLIEELNLSQEIQLLENVDDEMLCGLYNHAKAFLYPSHYEGFGIPLLEAMACGCPIVASYIPTSLEVAGDNPFYFELNSTESFLSALDRAVTTEFEQSTLDKWLFHARQYHWENTASLTLQAYKKL